MISKAIIQNIKTKGDYYMNITNQDLKKLTYLSSGTFGSVYHDGKNALKIYHPEVKVRYDFGYEMVSNPCLRPHPIKFRLIKYYNKRLKYTDLNYEPLYCNQQFFGICYPYYDGTELYQLKNIPFSEKEEIVKQLLRNAKELTDHHIYPLDYKLDNVLYTKKGEVKIIDLDDPLTKYRLIKHPSLYQQSMITLKNTVVHFLNSNSNQPYFSLTQFLQHKQQIYSLGNRITYQQLYDYLNIHNSKNNFLIIRPEQFSFHMISNIKALIKRKQTKIIVIDPAEFSYEVLQNFVMSLIHAGIEIYDIWPESSNKIENYINNYNISETFIIDKQKIKRR